MFPGCSHQSQLLHILKVHLQVRENLRCDSPISLINYDFFYLVVTQQKTLQLLRRNILAVREDNQILGITISNFLLRLGIDIRKILFRSVLSAFGGELEYIICGGAPLQEKYVQEFRSMGIEVLNGYGITSNPKAW